MGVDAEPVMILGLSVEELGLNLDEVVEAEAWAYEQYQYKEDTFEVRYFSRYNGPGKCDTYIGFTINTIENCREIDNYKKKFEETFGKTPKLQHFTHWW